VQVEPIKLALSEGHLEDGWGMRPCRWNVNILITFLGNILPCNSPLVRLQLFLCPTRRLGWRNYGFSYWSLHLSPPPPTPSPPQSLD
jgi:hypothetical protein